MTFHNYFETNSWFIFHFLVKVKRHSFFRKERNLFDETKRDTDKSRHVIYFLLFLVFCIFSWNILLNKNLIRSFFFFITKTYFPNYILQNTPNSNPTFDDIKEHLLISSPLFPYTISWFSSIDIKIYTNNSVISEEHINDHNFNSSFCIFHDKKNKIKDIQNISMPVLETELYNSKPKDLIITSIVRERSFKGIKTFLRSLRSTKCKANVLLLIDSKTKSIFKKQVNDYSKLYQVTFIDIGEIDLKEMQVNNKKMQNIERDHLNFMLYFDLFYSFCMNETFLERVGRILLIDSKQTIFYNDPFTELILENELQFVANSFFMKKPFSSLFYSMESMHQINNFLKRRENAEKELKKIKRETYFQVKDEKENVLDYFFQNFHFFQRYFPNEKIIFGPPKDILIFLDILLYNIKLIQEFNEFKYDYYCLNQETQNYWDRNENEENNPYKNAYNSFVKFENETKKQEMIEKGNIQKYEEELERDCEKIKEYTGKEFTHSINNFLNYIISSCQLSKRGVMISYVVNEYGYISLGNNLIDMDLLFNNIVIRNGALSDVILVQNYCADSTYVQKSVIGSCPQQNFDNMLCKS